MVHRMRTLQLKRLIEAIKYDINRMYETGMSAADISHYLGRKAKEVGYEHVR